jgi:hypothetical protein
MPCGSYPSRRALKAGHEYPRPPGPSDRRRLGVGICRRWPAEVGHWSLTTLREKLIKIGAKVVSRSKAVTFQMAEVAVPRRLFAAILDRIGCLRLVPGTG